VRQLRDGTDDDVPADFESQEDLVGYFFHCQAVLCAVARLEDEGRTPAEAMRLMPRTLEEEGANLRVPVTVGVPGIPPRVAHPEAAKSTIQSWGAPHD
jgi:hypothetical protein